MADTSPAMTPQQLLSAVRSQDPMRGLCASRQITDEGCDWLKFALDPFHDLQLDSLKGYPDVNTEPTVIVKVRQAIEISAPAGLAPNTNWDCHVALSPIDWAKPTGELQTTGTPVYDGHNAAAIVYPQGQLNGAAAGFIDDIGMGSSSSAHALTSRLDGLVVNSVPAGTSNGGDMTFTPGHMPEVAANGYAAENIVLDKYLDFEDTDLGVYRLVYSGFEVVNTTAQIYKQGACTVYEYGHSFENAQALTKESDHAGYHVGSNATNQFRCPPNTLAEAKIMPGAHTWAAQDGAYCTAKFQDTNPFQGATMRNYIVQQNNPTAGSASGYNMRTTNNDMGSFVSPGLIHSGGGIIGPNHAGLDAPFNATPATHFSHMSTAGAYFTGLSPQTTLFITWRVGIERLPSANKPTFLALAQPSATFDPNALLLYNLIANHLPPGCPQGWNDLGKWFNTIANIAKRVIPGAFPLVGAAQMILKGLGWVDTARALPGAIKGVQGLVGAVRNPTAPRRVAAAVTVQNAQRRRQRSQGSGKGGAAPAVQNFGQPGRRTPRRTQQFSQMS